MTAPAKVIAVFALVLTAGLGCAEPKPSTGSEDMSARRSAFDSASEGFHRGLRANDTTAVFAYVADDFLLMPPGEAVVRGKNALREWFNAFLTQFRTSALTFFDREVYVGDEWAFDLGTYEWTLTPAAGGAPVIDRGNYMQLWQMQPDGQWRFAREIWNSSAPAAPPAQ